MIDKNTKNNLESLKAFSKFIVNSAIVLAVLAIFLLMSVLSSGSNNGYGAMIIIIMASPLIAVFIYYWLFFRFIKTLINKNKNISRGKFHTLKAVLYGPWFLGLAIVVFYSYYNIYSESNKRQERFINAKNYYIDSEPSIKERFCSDTLFKCLPESQDKVWRQMQKQYKVNDIDYLELTPEVNTRYKAVRKKWNQTYEENEKAPYLTNSADNTWMRKVELKRYLNEREEYLEKEFPGYWGDLPKPIRYRWIRHAIATADKFGLYDNNQITKTRFMIELCARIGVDFDTDSKWAPVRRFIAHPNRRGSGATALDYIDFVILEKDKNFEGNYFSEWSLTTFARYLSSPKRSIDTYLEEVTKKKDNK